MSKVYTIEQLNVAGELATNEQVCECHRSKSGACSLGFVERYDHDGGVYVEGEKEKQWVYYTCYDCGYQWALWKVLRRLEKYYLPELQENKKGVIQNG